MLHSGSIQVIATPASVQAKDPKASYLSESTTLHSLIFYLHDFSVVCSLFKQSFLQKTFIYLFILHPSRGVQSLFQDFESFYLFYLLQNHWVWLNNL